MDLQAHRDDGGAGCRKCICKGHVLLFAMEIVRSGEAIGTPNTDDACAVPTSLGEG